MKELDIKTTQPMQHYLDLIEQLLEELYYVENVLDILNIAFSRQPAQEWAEATTHILTGYIRRIRVDFEKEFGTEEAEDLQNNDNE